MATKQQISLYFSIQRWVGLALLISPFCIFTFTAAFLLGLLAIAAEIFIIKTKIINVINDEKIEEHYKLVAEANYNRAVDDCGINQDDLIQAPDYFWYVDEFRKDIFPNNYNILKIKKGSDGIYRTNTRGLVILNYGKDQIFSWNIVVNIETNKFSTESTSEYFYRDIIGIEVNQNEILTLRTSGGNVEYPLAKDIKTHNAKKGLKASGDIEKAKQVIKAVKQMIREKKS